MHRQKIARFGLNKAQSLPHLGLAQAPHNMTRGRVAHS